MNVTLTAAQSDVVKTIRIVGGVFSLVGGGLMVLAILFYKLYYRKRERLVLMLSLSALFGSFSYVAGNMDFATGPCLWQAFWESFWDWVIIWWITVMAIDTFYTIIARGETGTKAELVYHLVVWSWSLVFALLPFAPAADGLPVYGDAGSWCWIRTGSEFVSWRWGVLYAWLFVFWFAVAALYVFSFWKIKTSEELRDLSDETKGQMRRLLLFPLVFILVWFFAMVNRAYEGAGNPHNFGLTIVQALLSSFQGFLNALVYFLTKDMRSRIMSCRREKPVDAKEYKHEPPPSEAPLPAGSDFMDVPLDDTPKVPDVEDPFASSSGE